MIVKFSRILQGDKYKYIKTPIETWKSNLKIFGDFPNLTNFILQSMSIKIWKT